jgi:hypothetical protein
MPDLFHSLTNFDLGFLSIVADRWGIHLNAPDAHSGLLILVKGLVDGNLFTEVYETLPVEAQAALELLRSQNGRIPWSTFIHRFGVIREMGIARRDREQPYLNPISVAEILWYRGLIQRAFLKTEDEPQEFAYVPDEFVAWIPKLDSPPPSPPGRPALPEEITFPKPVKDFILDQTCTILAAFRMNREIPAAVDEPDKIPLIHLKAFLLAAGLVDEDYAPLADPVRIFLEATRGESLSILSRRWLSSSTFNDLRLTPGLKCEGVWKNDPYETRQKLLALLREIPADHWWNISAFITGVKDRLPDFQRTAGEYDSWFIRKESDDTSLSGANHWEEVEGALIRFLITGPLHWLGIVDLATQTREGEPLVFRFSQWADSLTQEGSPPPDLDKEEAQIQVLPNGRIRVPSLAPRAVRYQIARFCVLDSLTRKEYQYQFTPASLAEASQQGLRINPFTALLRKHAASPLSPALIQALERWETNSVQASLEQVCILRVSSPEILNGLRRSPAARYLGNPLNATTIIIQSGAVEKVKIALIELGYLADDQTQL